MYCDFPFFSSPLLTFDHPHRPCLALVVLQLIATPIYLVNIFTIACTYTLYNIRLTVTLILILIPIPTPIHFYRDMSGFYKSNYSDADGNKKVMASTQFEALDARR